MISNVIIDPHVAPSLEKRLFTQRILSTRSPRFVVINAEYSKQADVLAKSPDACTVDFLSNHEIILTKNNLQSVGRSNFNPIQSFNKHAPQDASL